jgi:ABC-type polysaccharide/polyol phosphate export permease
MLLSAGFGLVLSGLHVYFRDIRYIVSASIFAWFYATPILYPLRLAPHVLRLVIEANPVTGCVELYRASVGAADPRWHASVLISLAWVAGLLAAASVIHRRFDRLFVDPL